MPKKEWRTGNARNQANAVVRGSEGRGKIKAKSATSGSAAKRT